MSERKDKKQQDPSWVRRGHEVPWKDAKDRGLRSGRGLKSRQLPRFPSPSLAVIVWGSGRLWRLRLGLGGLPGNCSDRPSQGPRSPFPTPMIDILLLAPAYLLPAACRYRLQTPFPCLILILFD